MMKAHTTTPTRIFNAAIYRVQEEFLTATMEKQKEGSMSFLVAKITVISLSRYKAENTFPLFVPKVGIIISTLLPQTDKQGKQRKQINNTSCCPWLLFEATVMLIQPRQHLSSYGQ